MKPIFLIHSGDRGQWVWPYWYHYFQEYWTCWGVVDAVFLTEVVQPEFPGVTSVSTGAGRPWGQGLMGALARLDTDLVIYAHEDYFLEQQTDPDTLASLVRVVRCNEDIVLLKMCGGWCGYIDNTRLFRPVEPGGKLRYDPEKIHGERLWTYDPDSPYVVSHQISIWRRDFLVATLKPHWSPWDHEMQGTPRASQWLKANDKRVYGYRRNSPLAYCETVVQNRARTDQVGWFERVHQEAGEDGFRKYCEMAKIYPAVAREKAGL